MGLFTKRQGDQQWVTDIKPPYEAACSAIADLNAALDKDSVEDQSIAIRRVLAYLPAIAKVVKTIPPPSSSEARQAHKFLNSALKMYMDGAKSGARFFNELAGGPGQRALHETGMARRAAVGRLVFNETFFKELVKSGRNHMERVSSYLQNIGE